MITTNNHVSKSLRKWIDLAKYEAGTDPYHGIFDTRNDHTFIECSKTFSLLQEKKSVNEINFFDNVQHKYGITCSNVEQWIDQYIDRSIDASKESSSKESSNILQKKTKKRNTKRRIIKSKSSDVQDQAVHGIFNPFRNSDHSFTCSCDYNPLCCVSLGGVMDEYLNVRIRDMSTKIGTNIVGYHTNTKKQINYFEMNGSNGNSDWIDKLNDQRIQQFKKSISTRKGFRIKSSLVKEHLRKHVVTCDNELLELMPLIQKFHSQLQENPETCNNDEFVFTTPVGMNNLGDTCYVNSFMQCFTANLGITQEFFNINFTKEGKEDDLSIPLELKSTLLKLVLGYSSALDTNSLCKTLKIEVGVQEDPYLLQLKLLDQIKCVFNWLESKLILSKLVLGYLSPEDTNNLCNALIIRYNVQDHADEF